jgi:hypothetical protein
MSVTCLHTIVVSSSLEAELDAAHQEAERIFRWVSPLSPEQANGWRSFFIPPDGGKEGGSASTDGDARRGDFIAWLQREQPQLNWCEVSFGSDLGYAERLIRSSAVDHRNELDERTQPHGDRRDYVKCPCGYDFVIYTYEPKGAFEGAQHVSAFEEEAGIFCEACETRFEDRPGLGWVPEGTPSAPVGPRSRPSPLGV